MFIGILTFILVLGVLIFVHELGHFLVARRNGVLVEEFSIGFPPRIFKKKKNGTVYSIGLIPFGGFVKIYGEDGQGKGNKNSFISKTVWQRTKIILAGVVMNVLLATVLLAVGYMMGLPSLVSESQNVKQVQIIEVAKDSPAQQAGLEIGDIIKRVSNLNTGEFAEVKSAQDLVNFSNSNRGENISIDILRGQNFEQLEVFVRAQDPLGQGPLGVAIGNVGEVSFVWYKAIWEAIKSTFLLLFFIVSAFVKLFWGIFAGGSDLGQISGPVGIYSLTEQAARMGFVYVLQFTVILSLHLAIINILPLPALDGGRILFLIIEKIKKSPVSRQLEQKIHTAGFLILILIMVLITFKDVAKLF